MVLRNSCCLIGSIIILFLWMSDIPSALSAQVIANGTTVDLNGATASTTTDNTPAILAINNGRVNANGANVTTSGNSSNGATATSSGHIVFNGSTVSTSGTSSFGIYASQNGVIDAFGPFISTTGANAAGIVADVSGTINLGGPTVQTSGTGAAGILALPGGTITGSVNVTTNNTNSPAISAAGGTITYQGGSINTHGGSSPAFAASSGGKLVASGFGEQTTGANSPVAQATSGGSISLSSAGLQTFGAGSAGVVSSGAGSTISVSSSSINTTGSNAFGMVAINGGTASLANASVTTSGTGSHALMLSNGGTINIASASATAQGGGSFGVSVDNSQGIGQSVLNLTNASLHSNTSDAIHVNAAHFTLNADQGTINAGSNNVLAFASNGALVNINGTNYSQFSGDIIASSSSFFKTSLAGPTIINMSLTNHSSWTGSTTTINNLNIDSTSVWAMTANSTVNGTLSLAGIIDFDTDSNNFETLTVTNLLSGDNGALALNTFLGGDGSPSDTLVISGGRITGSTRLAVYNTEGLGELTTGNGILLVNTINGGSTEDNAFGLAIPVVAGPYEYFLVRGARDGSNNDAWYLVNSFDNLPDVPPSEIPGDTPPPFKVSDQIPRGRHIPFYRREVSLAAAIPSQVLFYDHFVIDTLHERVGQQEQVIPRPCLVTRPYFNGAWLRVMHQNGTFNSNGIYRSGPSFDFYFNALQLGVDIYHNVYSNGSSDFAGITGVYGQMYGNVDHVKISNAGRNEFDAWSIGAFFTHYDPHGWYIDTLLLDTYHQIVADSKRGLPSFTINGHGLAGSLEAGYNFGLPCLITIEPEAQFILERLWLDSSRENAFVSFDPTNSVLTRVGARLTHTFLFPNRLVNTLTTWLFGNYWHEFQGNSRTNFPTLTNTISFASDIGISWRELGVGVSAFIKENVSIYATGKYIDYNNDHGYGAGGEFGVMVNL